MKTRRDFLKTSSAVMGGAFLGSLYSSPAAATLFTTAFWKKRNSATGWIATTATGAPSACFSPLICWTGSRVLIWGGKSSTYPLDSGGLFDPLTNSWTAIPASAAAIPQYDTYRNTYCVGAWTGSKFITFDGLFNADNSNFNTAGRIYDPATNLWTAMQTTGRPSNRSYFSGCWTGTQFIIYGGGAIYLDGDMAYGGGGVYTLASNTWSSLKTTTSRNDHSAVWVGSRMLVWGGNDRTTGLSNDLKSYDPVTNNWSFLATAPITGRRYHSAVSTGDKMIIWGGSSGGTGVRNDGAVYDIASNMWTPITTVGAPSARYYHTAVWTGSKMIVWGGYGYDGTYYSCNDGGIYDPLTDSWMPITTVDAPSVRYQAGATWTGTQFFVWGGRASGNLNTGGYIQL